MITSESYILIDHVTDMTKLQKENQWHKGSKMGKWYYDTKNRNRGNGMIRCDSVQMAKGCKIGTNGKRDTVALTEEDKRCVTSLREFITNTSILLAHHAT